MRRIVVTSILLAVMLGMFGIIGAQADTPNTVRYGAKGCILYNSGNCQFNVTGSQSWDRGVGGILAGTATITHIVITHKSGPSDPGPGSGNVSNQNRVEFPDGHWEWDEHLTVTDWTWSVLVPGGCSTCFAQFAVNLQNGINYTLTLNGTGVIAAGSGEM